MIRLLLALAIVGIVIVTTMRMFSSQVGGVARVTGAELGASAAAPGPVAPATPRATVDQAAQAVQQALQQGAAAQAARASEAGN